MRIAIYNPLTGTGGAERIGIITRAEAEYTEHINTAGNFRISMPLAAPHADKLCKNRIICFDDGFCGIIESISLSQNRPQSRIEAEGKCLKGLLERRVTVPPAQENIENTLGYDAVKGSSETCIKHYWNVNCVNPSVDVRKIPGFEIAKDQGRGVTEDKYLSRFETVSDVTQKIAQDTELAVIAAFDSSGGKYMFDVYAGENRTADQNENPRIIFEIERKSIISMSYSDSDENLKNVFYVTKSGAEFEDEALTMTYYRDDAEVSGFFRREVHLNLSADTPVAGEEYQELKRVAQIEMTNYESAESITAEVNQKYQYKRDYQIGDYVTIRNREWNITRNMQITAVQKSMSAGKTNYTLTFGTPPAKVLDKIKRDIKNK